MAAQQRSESKSPAKAASTRASGEAPSKTFTGASIEDVLAEVRAELGANAEIVEANKIRSGGIGGFFAKESFEVVARRKPKGALPQGIDEEAFDRAAAHVAAAARGGDAGGESADLMDLVDQVSADESARAPAPAPTPTPVSPQSPQAGPNRHTPDTASPQSPRPGPNRHARGGDVSSAPAQPAQPVVTPQPPPGFEPLEPSMPKLSTEGGAFNDVLHRIASDAGPEIAEAIDRRLGGPRLGESTPPQPGRTGHHGTPEAPLRHPAERGLTPVGPQARSRAQQAAEQARPTPVADAPAEVHHPAPTRPAAAAATPHAAPDEAAPALVRSSEATEQAPATAGDRTERLLSWLQRDNLPRTTLMTALRALPKVPDLPDTTGVVVAVVGRRQDALKLCRKMAKAVGADTDDVVLASASYRGSAIPEERRIIDITDAERERKAWRRRALPTFVAVDASSSVKADALTWTREIVDQLEAHHVVGVVSAGRKVSDIASWAQRIGGVDAFALKDMDETDSPYSILALEIPVAYLDGEPATAGAWAHVLLEGSDR